MTSTRENMNAARIENAVQVTLGALATSYDLYVLLGPYLPDEFPPLDEDFVELKRMLEALAEKVQ